MTSIKEFKADLTETFRRNTSRGYADWRQCGNLCYYACKILERAETEMLRQKRYGELFDLANTAFLKWEKTDKDDSNGETMSFMATVEEIWHAVHEADSVQIPRAKMLVWFTDHLDISLIDYMEDYLLKFITEHFKEESLQHEKLKFFDERIRSKEKEASVKSYAAYEIRNCQESILRIFGEMDRPIEEIRAYASKIGSRDAQEILAQIEYERGNKQECMELYRQMADRFDNQRYGDCTYSIRLKDLYKEAGEEDRYFDLLSKLVYDLPGKDEIFTEYKSCFSGDEWPAERERLFSMFEEGDPRPASWYCTEGDFDRLMTAVEHAGAFWLKEYEGELITRFPERCLRVVARAADDQAHRAKKRSDYRRLAELLQWMRRYPGGRDLSAKYAQKYREAYPRRSALQDELEGL